MRRPRVLALILAGGEGGRLGVLTQERAKPAIPFAGVYKLIDFALSNCVHSHISDVWVLQQYRPHSLIDHLSNGRPWDLDRTYGGLRVMHPYLGAEEEGWYQGNADAIYRNSQIIRSVGPDILLVLSADHIYKLDFNEVINHHLEKQSAVTMVTTEVPLEQAGRFGTVQASDDGRITEFEYKPESPRSGTVTTEVFVYDAATLLDSLDALCRTQDEGAALQDFGHELIPHLVADGRAYEYKLEGYWRDVGVIESYWQAHMDLLESEPRILLDDPDWPILTLGVQRPPARIESTAQIAHSLISPGCTVRGQVERSVLGPGVVVEEGAYVRDSVLLHDARVGRGATVSCTILDSSAEIDPDTVVGMLKSRDGGTAEITVVGRAARVAEQVQAGDRVEIAAGTEG